MKKVMGYIRISSNQQNVARQYEIMKQEGVNERDIFADIKSGKDFIAREQYQLLKKIVRSGDTVLFTELDRLGRNYSEVKEELQWFKSQKVNIRILDLPILDSVGLEGELIQAILIELYSYLSEKERLKIRERQKLGIQLAKNIEGKYRGRKPKELDEDILKKMENKEITISKGCKLMGIDTSTYYKRKKNKSI